MVQLWLWLFVALSELASQTFFCWLKHSGGSCSAAAREVAAVGGGWGQRSCGGHRSRWIASNGKGSAIETMVWRHCGWWNNSAVSETGISNLTRSSSHLLVRWEPSNRRMFRCQNDVEKYGSDKSTRPVWDFVVYSQLRRQWIKLLIARAQVVAWIDLISISNIFNGIAYRHTCLCEIMRPQVLAHM